MENVSQETEGEMMPTTPAKKKPNKQHDMRAASLLRMASDARDYRAEFIASACLPGEPRDSRAPMVADALLWFAKIHEREAKRLRAMR